jgi:hypothetical protein
MGEEVPDGDAIMAAWLADEKDREEGRPEKANRIRFGDHGTILEVKVRGRYRSLAETFSEPRGPAADKASMDAGYRLPDALDDAQDGAARRLDHSAMKQRLGPETCRVLELAVGVLTSEEIGAECGASGKNAERLGVRLVDGAIAKLRAVYAARDAADRETA